MGATTSASDIAGAQEAQEATAAGFLPESRSDLQLLLDTLMIEKVVYELGYELNNRPDWVRVPLRGILQLLESAV